MVQLVGRAGALPLAGPSNSPPLDRQRCLLPPSPAQRPSCPAAAARGGCGPGAGRAGAPHVGHAARPAGRRSVALAAVATDLMPSRSREDLPPPPQWRNHLSRQQKLSAAVDECVDAIVGSGQQRSHGQQLDTAIVFVSSSYGREYEGLVELLRQRLPGLKRVFGCSGFGIIGRDDEGPHEVENLVALSLTLTSMPQAELVLRHVTEADLPDGDASPGQWSQALGVPAFPDDNLNFIVLAHPQFSRLQDLLEGLDFAFPEAKVAGGLANMSTISARLNRACDTATFAWSEEQAASGACPSHGVWRRGASVLAIHGGIDMDLIVSQGCQPLSEHTWVVEEVHPRDPHRITALSSTSASRGRPVPAMEAFQGELQHLAFMQAGRAMQATVSNLAVGLAPEAHFGALRRPGTEPPPQDYVVRSLLGFSPDEALVVGGEVKVGQRLRFMVRGQDGARAEVQSQGLAYKRRQLQAMMRATMAGGPVGGGPGAAQGASGGGGQQAPFGMMLFSCSGRGGGLYGEESYDARAFSEFVPVPVAGFQGDGEIGKVGNATRRHGLTCTACVLRPSPSGAVGVGAHSGGASMQQEP